MRAVSVGENNLLSIPSNHSLILRQVIHTKINTLVKKNPRFSPAIEELLFGIITNSPENNVGTGSVAMLTRYPSGWEAI